MKSSINYILLGALFISMQSFAQINSNDKKKEVKMETQSQHSMQVCFIDKFFIPKNSINEFKQKMKYNRIFVNTISGYVKSDAFEQLDSEGNLTIMTITVWENQEYLDQSKVLVQAEFKRINFNPAELYQRLNVKLERGLYKKLND